MTLSFSGRLDRDAMVRAAESAGDLVRRPEVFDAWGRESSCVGMTVGGLGRHVVEQARYVVEYLPMPVPAEAPRISLLEHYARSGWAHEDADGPENRGICDEWNAQAALEGPAETAELQARAVSDLAGVLDRAGRWMYLPWQDVAMPTDDFLVTRMMEIVVHADDLAVSLDLPTPSFDPSVLEPVLGLLAGQAVVRHGQDAVVRVLARPQRAPRSIAAF